MLNVCASFCRKHSFHVSFNIILDKKRKLLRKFGFSFGNSQPLCIKVNYLKAEKQEHYNVLEIWQEKCFLYIYNLLLFYSYLQKSCK